MALSLGVSEGSKIEVGANMVTVRRIITSTLIVVAVDGGPDVTVSEQEKIELMPGVFVFAGVGGSGLGNRLAFEAPRSVNIRRLEA